jgi:hypothetical protein
VEWHVVSHANNAPVASVPNANVSASAGHVLQVSTLVNASDADNDPLTYFLYDNTVGGGHFEVGGVVQPEQQFIVVNQAQLAQTTFVTGPIGANDDLIAAVYDGTAASNAVEWHVVSHANNAPVASVPNANVSASAGQVLSVSTLINASDADSDPLTYFLYDNTVGGGHFEVGGVAQPDHQFIVVNQAQLAQTTFVAGPGGSNDDLIAAVYDGTVASNSVEWHVLV